MNISVQGQLSSDSRQKEEEFSRRTTELQEKNSNPENEISTLKVSIALMISSPVFNGQFVWFYCYILLSG